MTAELFTARRPDGRAYWRVIYDRFITMVPGETVSYGELLELLEEDDKVTVYGNARRAAHKLRQAVKRDVAVVRGEGYRMLMPNEHVTKAVAIQDRAEHQIHTAIEVIDATDVAGLTGAERDLHFQMKRGFTLVGQALSMHAEELARHEQLIANLSQRVEGLEQAS